MKNFLLNGFSRTPFLPLLFCLCTCFINHSHGQTFNCYAVFSDSARGADSLLGSFYINGVDTTNTSQVELKVGDAVNDSSSVYQVVDFDNPSGLPSGFSYSRNGNNLLIHVSSSKVLWTYYCSVRIKNGSGLWGDPFRFITN